VASSPTGAVLGRGGTDDAFAGPAALGFAEARSANGDAMGTLAETRSVASGELGAGAGKGSADPSAPAADASVGGAECGELRDCGGGSGRRGAAGRLLVTAPRTSGGGVPEVRPVRTGGGGGRLRVRGSAELSGAVSGAGVGTDGRGGVLTVGRGAMPGNVPSDVAPGGTAPAGTEGWSGEALWSAGAPY
jgi:hypothetical protein